MNFIKYECAQRFVNSQSCSGLEYLLHDGNIDCATAVINGRCKDLVFVIQKGEE